MKGDGIADDSAVLQQAINQIQEKTNQGILFVPPGRYRLTQDRLYLARNPVDRFRAHASRLCARRQHSGFSARALLYVVFRGCSPERECASAGRQPGHVLFRNQQYRY